MSRRSFFPTRPLAALLFVAAPILHAQNPSPSPAPAAPAPSNVIANGGFENATSADNLWDGVDSAGFLVGFKGGESVLLEEGRVGATAMPISVGLADMNGDGLLDIVAGDPPGYLRFFFNVGTANEPKFATSDILSVFMAENIVTQRIPRIFPAKLKTQSATSLLVGNYTGELFLLQNFGSAMVPDFRQPPKLADIAIPTAPEGRLWGNVFSPAAVDLNGDRNLDLLVGEGSYSANSIHLFLNKGSNSAPRFAQDARYYLAYGDGREQLIPAVADWNGDGRPDLLVSDRTGKLNIYLNPGPGWKPGDEFPHAGTVQFGGSDKLPGLCAPSAGDLNADGLFDLILGKNNGRIAMALNTGNATQPKFGALVELKGTDVNLVGEAGFNPAKFNLPAEWSSYTSFTRGNFLGYVTLVDNATDAKAAVPQGKLALRVGYVPNMNRVLKAPSIKKEGNRTYEYFMLTASDQWGRHDAGNAHWWASNRTFVLRSGALKLKNNTSYEVSMQARGIQLKNAQWTLAWFGEKETAPEKRTAGERGTVDIRKTRATESNMDRNNLMVGAEWRQITKTVRVSFKNSDLKDVPAPSLATFEIICDLESPDATLYLDDVKIIEKAGP